MKHLPLRFTAFLAAIASLSLSGTLLAQATNYPSGQVSTGPSIVVVLFELIIAVLLIAGLWKVFVKAGQPGWASIIPIYNTYILCKIVGKPGWWVILMFIPFLNFIIAIIIMLELAKCFGKGVGFAVGLILLSFVFIPMLGFSDAAYQGPKAASAI